MTFAERLKELRVEKGLSLEEVGKEIDVGRATMSKYEHGTIKKMPNEKIEKLAELFNVSPAYLMGWTDNRFSIALNPDAPNGIAFPDGEVFARAYSVMSYQDRVTLIDIFTRAYEKIQREEGNT